PRQAKSLDLAEQRLPNSIATAFLVNDEIFDDRKGLPGIHGVRTKANQYGTPDKAVNLATSSRVRASSSRTSIWDAVALTFSSSTN
ncbi:hypothetical protein C3L29_034690, partial [Pseudomonas sp. MWU12-2534b]